MGSADLWLSELLKLNWVRPVSLSIALQCHCALFAAQPSGVRCHLASLIVGTFALTYCVICDLT